MNNEKLKAKSEKFKELKPQNRKTLLSGKNLIQQKSPLRYLILLDTVFILI